MKGQVSKRNNFTEKTQTYSFRPESRGFWRYGDGDDVFRYLLPNKSIADFRRVSETTEYPSSNSPIALRQLPFPNTRIRQGEQRGPKKNTLRVD
ncbi:ATP-dependent DNA helicase PIF1 [Fusarium oxysporum f. sp. albedinis]|nr:ATP-dependent DNA helicase PIF1 [Fusarium oxysporum f. sp. albedinis]